MEEIHTKPGEFGAALVEYALLVALIAAACTAVGMLGETVDWQFTTINAQLEESSGESGGGLEGGSPE